MSTIAPDRPESPVVPLRFTTVQFERMAKTGVLAAGKRYELLDGQIIPMSPPGPEHCAHVDTLYSRLFRLLGETWQVRCQGNILLNRHTEPQPDFAILRQDPDHYRKRHPGPGDIMLLIEVSDSTLTHDRTRKAEVYAAAGVVEYWIINLRQRRVHVFRRPAAEGYLDVTTHEGEDEIQALELPTLRLRADEILLPPG